MKFTKPSWVMYQDGTHSENMKRLSIFSPRQFPHSYRRSRRGNPHMEHETYSQRGSRRSQQAAQVALHAHHAHWPRPYCSGKVWGSDEVNVEGWKPLKCLPGHESDVAALAWAPGLDSQVMICTFFRRLSWSPDGAHITASNATHNNGYVFTVAVIAQCMDVRHQSRRS
ncbi:HIR1_3 [Sanghuangporus weigelae]